MRVLAAAQTIPIRGDVDANVDAHIRLIGVAAEQQAQVVIFPELSLTGYELDLADELAFTATDARLDRLIAASSHSRMTLIVGAPVRIASRLYIGAFILSADGTADLYTKHHLGAFAPSDNPGGTVPAAEASVFHPGDRNPVIRIADMPAAVAVCADVSRASHPNAAADRGAKTYLASMFVIPSDLTRDLTRLRTYAERHSMAVVFANYGGPSGGLPSGGYSAIWSPTGKLLAQLKGRGSGVVVASESDSGWHAKTIMIEAA